MPGGMERRACSQMPLVEWVQTKHSKMARAPSIQLQGTEASITVEEMEEPLDLHNTQDFPLVKMLVLLPTTQTPQHPQSPSEWTVDDLQ